MQIEIQNQCQNLKLFPDSGLVIIYHDFSIMLVTQDILLLNHKKSCGQIFIDGGWGGAGLNPLNH